MKILVTGGAGFIGSAFIRYILQNTKDTVINVDKLTYAGDLNNLGVWKKSKRHIFSKTDICNIADLKNIFNKHKPNKVIHFAAESHVDNSILNPETFINTNILGTYNLLEVSRIFFQSLKSKNADNFVFHHVSTDEVYGDLPHPDDKNIDDNDYFFEHSKYEPSSPYSASKAGSDHLVRAWHRTFNLPIIVSNCSNNYGPYQNKEKFIPNTIFRAINNEHIPIYGDGSQIRDWLFVDDHVEALYKILNSKFIGETFNIGGLNELRNIHVAEKICEILDKVKNKEPNKSYKKLIKFSKDRPGHDKRYAINCEKIKNKLNWKPNESFSSGILKTINWYIELFEEKK